MIFKKFDKNNYTQLKTYRSIAFFNTLKKRFEKIIIIKLSHLVEKYQLLFKKHIKDRKFSSIENAIYIILEEIHKAWKIKDN